MERLQQSLGISVAYLSQLAAEAAFGARDELEAVRRGNARNRTYLLDSYRKSAAQTFIRRAAGALYLHAILAASATAGVAATTGLDFDRTRSSHVAALVCGLV
jgi:aspartate/methionine/tyrosine aminotransferase